MEFSGRLASFPIGDVLQWAHNDRRTGALVVRKSGREKRIFFRDGDVVSCLSDDAAEFFGQHLLVSGLVDDRLLVRALTVCQKTGKRLGQTLVELGILGLGAITEALGQQIQDLVCDVFLWKSGIFYFNAEMPPQEELLPEPISAVTLALEGSRWNDEYQRIRRLFVHDNIVLTRGSATPPASASALERRIYRAVDGRQTLAELYNEVRGSYFRFLEAAYRMTVAQAFDIRTVGDEMHSSSTELRLTDLLIEQVAEEHSVVLRQQLALPFDAIEHTVPIWTRELDPRERRDLAPATVAFYEAIDGKRTLGELFAVSSEERLRRLDGFVRELRRGSLALLPVAAERLGEALEAMPEATRGTWWRRVFAKS